MLKKIKRTLWQKLELYWVSLVKGERSPIVRLLLTPISAFYGSFITLRNWLYREGWRRTYHPPVPCVVSIGNIVIGGTGKTPITLKLAEQFANDHSVAILSRGYGGGDEARLLENRLPNVKVIVGKNRIKSANEASKEGANVLFLDDGFQHRKLARDFDLVVIHASDPVGRGSLFPHGFLREPPESLKRADLIFLNHSDQVKENELLHQALKQWTDAPIVDLYYRPTGIYSLSHEPLESIKGKKVGGFCGIAHPERFLNTLTSMGAEVVYFRPLSDHAPLGEKQVKKMLAEAEENEAEFLLCTEKDAVKLESTLPVSYVKMEIELPEESIEWHNLLLKIGETVKKRS